MRVTSHPSSVSRADIIAYVRFDMPVVWGTVRDFLMRLIRDEDKVCPVCGSCDVSTGVGGGFLGAGTSTTGSIAAGCGTGGFT